MSKCEQCITRKLSSLKALTAENLRHLSKCKDSIEIKKGESLFEEGQMLKGIFCINDGVCKISKLNADGKDTILKLAKKGDIIGQRSIFSDEASTLSATAVEDMKVCFIPKTEILYFFENNTNFSKEVAKDLSNQLKMANDFATSHSHKTVKQRLASTLLLMQSTKGTDEEGYIKLHLSREEIANMVGTATESCIRLLSELKKEELIYLKNKNIKILNKERLSQMAE